MKILSRLILIAVICSLTFNSQVNASAALANPPTNPIYVPLFTAPTVLTAGAARINAPYFAGDAASHFSEAAIFWFGKVNSTDNYADLRVAYDNTKLWVYLAAFDRYLWYNPQSTPGKLKNGDSATLQINLNGNTGAAIGAQSYQFDGAMSWFEPRNSYQAAYKAQNATWTSANLSFQTIAGYDGYFNDNVKASRGWAMSFEIPFASLGLSGPPADGSIWGISMIMHDRDDAQGVTLNTSWPAAMQGTVPSTWAQLRFGLPPSAATNAPVTGSDLIRRDASRGIDVKDAAVGGTTPNLCPGDDAYIWNTWGNANFGATADFNIQNQSKITDWPCFAKYFITFPITTVPANKTILSARLILHQQGGAGAPGQATPSLIQVLTIGQDWNENTITWNNAPPPLENISRTLVDVPTDYGNWPKVPRYWDVTAAVIKAYQSHQPVRLVLYEADSDYHSGKYFTSSDTGPWNMDGHPSLEIKWGN